MQTQERTEQQTAATGIQSTTYEYLLVERDGHIQHLKLAAAAKDPRISLNTPARTQ